MIELLHNLTDDVTEHIGDSFRKLVRFTQSKIPVSKGFIISPGIFREYIRENMPDLHARKISHTFHDFTLSPETLKQLKKKYEFISGFTEPPVVIYSVAVDSAGKEYPQTLLKRTAQGYGKIVEHIKNSYDTIVQSNEMYINDFLSGKMAVSILIQKVQQIDVSGVLYTSNVVTKDNNTLVIEAMYGSESHEGYDPIIPDHYFVDKLKKRINEKYICTQTYMLHTEPNGAIKKIDVPEAWQTQQKIPDASVLQLAELGTMIETQETKPQILFWHSSHGKFFIDFVQDANTMSSRKGTRTSIQDLINKQITQLSTNI